MTTGKLTTPSYQLYQEMLNSIFGSGSIAIKQDVDNNIIGTLKNEDDHLEFKKNFEARLTRLKNRYNDKPSYKDLLETIAQVADHRNWEGAYAELVAYDVMSNDYLPGVIELNKTLPVTESFASEMGGRATNEDGYISQYDIFFDVKILSDAVGIILKGIINDAISQAGQNNVCNIIPEYPLDDNEQIYQENRRDLMEELRDYIEKNIPASKNGKSYLKSKKLHRLSFQIKWGSGVNSSMGVYNPYKHAEECRHLIFKRYTKKIMKNKPFFLVMINFPWYNKLVNCFDNVNEVFYRSLARRTFCAYKNLPTKMSDIVSDYGGNESVYEVSRHLSGIIFIDDKSINEDKYSCHIYLNPNAYNKSSCVRTYLERIVETGDDGSLFDDMEHDNY